jgi:arylsulfatase A-like enzyme
LILVDTLRADHLGCYGYGRKTSPHIDALAADGIVFENGWAHAPSTRYSMPAIITSRWPSAIRWEPSLAVLGPTDWWPRISPSQTTLPQALHRLGYFTAAFWAYNYFIRADARGFERDIDVYDDRRAALHQMKGGHAESVGSSGREMADDAIEFLNQRDQEAQAGRARKFFLTLHFYDPHLDYERHRDAPDFGGSQADLYDGEIWFTDMNIGRVLDRVKQLGLYDKTAILISGDHGEGLGEHGIVAHGYDLFAPQTKVPFVARVPGLPPRRVKEPVGHVDVAPTLVNLARGPQEATFLGRSFLDLMTGTVEGAPPVPVYQEVSFEPLTPASASTERRALASATHHLVWRWIPENTTFCYDLRHDPGEEHDLWGAPAGEPDCSALKSELRQRMSVLKLAELPPDFAEKIAAGVTAPGAKAPAPQVPGDARFGDAIRFLGHDLASPEGGAYPTERWRPGQTIRDRFTITTDVPGAYTLYVGLWQPPSSANRRMPVTPANAQDGHDRLRALTFTVE